jgi:uncharacterized repeat protein (TIGR01451 family)
MKHHWILAITILAALILVSGHLYGVMPVEAAHSWQGKVDPWVFSTTLGEETEVLVFMAEQANLEDAAKLKSKFDKGKYVYESLSRLADRTQKPLLAILDSLEVDYRSYWAANMIWVRGDLEVIQAIAQRADVDHIYANPKILLEEPVLEPLSVPQTTRDNPRWNITLINADDVWAAGINGQGVVIGGQDTGYDWDHPALIDKYRGWDGASATHDYNWHDAIHSGGGSCGPDSAEPCDDYGHGTHTMGTMVGDDGGSNQIGVAPGAKWIGCRNMDVGYGTPERYIECYQWFIAPTKPDGSLPRPDLAPDVINNSWSCPPSEGCNTESLRAVVEAVHAAGIVTVHSAGNNGPSCSSVNVPAAIYEESFAIGSTNSGDAIAYRSSRGPVSADGSYRLKPNVAAPGVSIYSSLRGGAYGSMSGTSMAAPHVAGLVALLISTEPKLSGQVDAIETLIERSALPLYTSDGCGGDTTSSHPNHTYGWGRIDSLAAFDQRHQLEITKTPSANQVEAGDLITYTINVHHTHIVSPTTNIIISDTLPAGVTFISATTPFSLNDDSVSWSFSKLDPNVSLEVQLVVQVLMDATGFVANSDYSVQSDDVSTVLGNPVQTTILPFNLKLEHAVSATTIAPGENLTYTLSVHNPHPSAIVHNVTITDSLPTGTELITATMPHTMTGKAITWKLGELEPGASWSAVLLIRIPFTATIGSVIENNWSVHSDETTTLFGQPVQTLVQNLTVDKSASTSIVLGGDLLTYTLVVTNLRPISATQHVVLTDTIPDGTTLVTATIPHMKTGALVTWTNSEISPKNSWIVEFVVQVSLGATGVITNDLYGATSDETPVPAQGSPVYVPIHTPGVQLSPGSRGIAEAGSTITYTHQVSNTGNYTDTFNLTLESGAGWSTLESTSFTLGPNRSGWFNVLVSVPESAATGSLDVTGVTARSEVDPETSATVWNTTVVPFRLLIPLFVVTR